jgi:hypothetical protein
MKLPKDLREKRELSVTGSKMRKCSIVDCNETAIRSLSENKWSKYLEKAELKYNENKNKKIYLCKLHYKEVNKIGKSAEKLHQKKGFLDDVEKSREFNSSKKQMFE